MPYVPNLIGDISERGYYDNPNQALAEELFAQVDANFTAIGQAITAAVTGDIQLTGDLGGTDAAPTVVGVHSGATGLTVGTITDGQVLTRSGTTITGASIGTASGTVCAGNDARLANARVSANPDTTPLSALGLSTASFSGKLATITPTYTLNQLLAAIDAIV